MVEPLEGRVVPATIQVTSVADSGPGTLRAVIEQADVDAAQDTITFAPSVIGTITLSTALPDLSAGMNIVGPGPSVLTLARSSANGTPGFRVFTVDAGAEVTISGLTLMGSTAAPGPPGLGLNGGIDNSGTLTVMNSTFTGNSNAYEYRLTLGAGGALDNVSGTLTVINCTINGNSSGSFGGGIANFGSLTVINSTVSNNTVAERPLYGDAGGGISSFGALTVIDSTISGNSVAGGQGGGIYLDDGTAALTNTIVATNEVSETPQDIQGSVTTSSHNVVGVNSGLSGITNGVNGNLIGTANSPIDPRLGQLQDNGGPTWTMALLPGSPAIDAGVQVLGVAVDQRGVFRPQGRAPDIGAFELQLPTVLDVQRHGVQDQVTTLVVTFSHPMDASSAEDLADYRLVSAGPDNRFGTRDDRAIRIRSARYDATSNTVTLRPAHRLPLRQRYRLEILGTPPDGLRDTTGLFLDGGGTGQQGSNFVMVITDKL